MTLKDFFGTVPETTPAYIMDYRTGLELYSTREKTPGRLPGSIRNKRVIDYMYLTGKNGEYIEIYINNGKPWFELEL